MPNAAAPVAVKVRLWLLSLPKNAHAVREQGKRVTTLMLAVARVAQRAGDFAIALRAELREASIGLSLEKIDNDLAGRNLALKSLIRLAQNNQDLLCQKKSWIHLHTFTPTPGEGQLVDALRLPYTQATLLRRTLSVVNLLK